MYKIEKLSDDVINQIAAGEVIERPSSVVKELLENSIDANANSIIISVEQGGKKKISVIDNGYGIDDKYLKLAIEKHATSKLRSKNITKINSLGFRGEALYSIASASSLTIISKTPNMTSAKRLTVKKNIIKEFKPIKGKEGTQVIVEDLFINMPVRRKFLKTDRAENLAVRAVVKKISIANPKVGFKLFEDNKLKINYANLENKADTKNPIEERVAAVLGYDFLEASFYINTSSKGYDIKGYISIPTFNKPNWNESVIVINNRIIKDRLLYGAIKAAYSGVLAGGRFPIVAIFIDIKPEDLDINVHPTKSEVRILERSYLNSLLISQIRSCLEKVGLRNSIVFEKELLNKIQHSSSHANKNIELNLQHDIDSPRFSEDFINKKEKNVNQNFRLGFAIAQVNKMFIISQAEGKLILIDQHAAHERIVLESIKENYKNNKVARQVLLVPQIVKIEKSKTLMLENRIEIEKIGIIFEDYGENDILVREIPAILGKINIQYLFDDLIEKIKMIGKIEVDSPKIEEIFSSIACHNSIRAGRKLNIEEMNSLLRLMERTRNAGQCNHGRPTFIELNFSDIEKMFGRI